MAKYVIHGGKQLKGSINIQGAKNSVLPMLAATVLCREKCVIHNCPDLSDVSSALNILRKLGCACLRDENTVIVDASEIAGYEIPEDLMREMRSSIVFLGAVISRVGKAVMYTPGGCELGPRPIDLHIKALTKLGVNFTEYSPKITCEAPTGITGNEISLSFPSVGATENIILAAACSKGKTVIYNAAKEPEISDLADFLNKAGAKINGAGSDTITINGVKALHGVEHYVIPDRIVASTYLCAAAITHGWITLNNAVPSHITAVIDTLKNIGCEIKNNNGSLILTSPEKFKNIGDIRSCVYPGFPTDAGPVIMPILALTEGTMLFYETIFDNRFRYIEELNRFGTKITVCNNYAVIKGVKKLNPANTKCTDLRAGAAITLAALSANGQSKIDDIFHIERGYASFSEDLRKIGAEIYREE